MRLIENPQTLNYKIRKMLIYFNSIYRTFGLSTLTCTFGNPSSSS